MNNFQFLQLLSLDFPLWQPINYIILLCQLWAGWLSRYSDWLRAGRSGERIPVETRFSAPVQTGPGAHPVSCTMGTGSFLGVKSGRGVTLTPSPPSSTVGHERLELYLYSPYGPYGLYRASMLVQGCTLPSLCQLHFIPIEYFHCKHIKTAIYRYMDLSDLISLFCKMRFDPEIILNAVQSIQVLLIYLALK